MKQLTRLQILSAIVLILGLGPAALGQRKGVSVEEIQKRREVLMSRLDGGMVVLFGDCMPQPGIHFRQENDFFYFSGVEDTSAILVMAPQTRETFLFLPRQTEREAGIEGGNLLKDPRAAETSGLTAVYPADYFDEFIGRNVARLGKAFHLRMGPRDFVDNARRGHRIFSGRKNRIHYNDQVSLDNHRIQKLKEHYPDFLFKDITDMVDRMRLIKSPEEIEILRRNGQISAEAVKQAMLATRPGVYEYELEAALLFTVFSRGARGVAYPPIVASGPNSCIGHYDKNNRKIESGDVVLVDFGADLDHYCMDISRTWPASGTFSKEQKEIYKIVLEVQKACIEAYRPGVTAEDVRRHVAEVMRSKGLDSMGIRGGLGHYVGMSVHDVGPTGIPLEEGMVFAIEPSYKIQEKNLGIRIEDTVLITRDGCEVLTSGVPKEIEEIERLIKSRSR